MVLEPLLQLTWWQRRIYGPTYRFIARLRPRRIADNLHWKRQRVERGWSDRDAWSLDSHLCRVITGGVRSIRDNSHGYPSDLTPEAWTETLNKIAYGFQCGLALINMDYVEVAGKTMIDRETGRIHFNVGASEEEVATAREREEAERLRLQAAFDEGFDLFRKYFFDLWD